MNELFGLNISNPTPSHYIVKETRPPLNTTEPSTTSALLPKASLHPVFPPFTAYNQLLGPGVEHFSWNGGPIEITGIVSSSTLGTGFELLFNERNGRSRVIGVFWGDLQEGVKVEYIDQSGKRVMRLDLKVREGKYVWADAERDYWAKKRVVLVLDTGKKDGEGHENRGVIWTK